MVTGNPTPAETHLNMQSQAYKIIDVICLFNQTFFYDYT